MSSVATLTTRLKSLERHIEKSYPAKTWVFVLEEGQDLTPEQRAKFRPADTVVIEFIPVGYFGEMTV